MPSVPKYTIQDHEPGFVIGELSHLDYGQETWIRDGYVGDLFDGSLSIPGRWHKVKSKWKFTPDDKEHLPNLVVGSVFKAYDGYWGERIEIICSAKGKWASREWTDETDHDHCRLCWATLSTTEQQTYWERQGWRICEDCYESNAKYQRLNLNRIGGPGDA